MGQKCLLSEWHATLLWPCLTRCGITDEAREIERDGVGSKLGLVSGPKQEDWKDVWAYRWGRQVRSNVGTSGWVQQQKVFFFAYGALYGAEGYLSKNFTCMLT
ncbi:hypothetical protein AMTR_s00006p00253980 [Amborella trichopoda]|uniref:Uncharacterized protein n=1 Tax=Amborella trichopoda TaxID=13333 RepID=W1PDS8_AMBTC|nr:hypothetical protein AMTR_s00006p00253980 [Amborella trichopoda]